MGVIPLGTQDKSVHVRDRAKGPHGGPRHVGSISAPSLGDLRQVAFPWAFYPYL